MAAGVYNLPLEQGVTFRTRITIRTGTPAVVLNLTGYTARLQFRTSAGAAGGALLDLTSENGGLTLGGAAGTIDVFITAAQTTAMTEKVAVYDLEIYAPNGDTTRVLKGSVAIDAEVTR